MVAFINEGFYRGNTNHLAKLVFKKRLISFCEFMVQVGKHLQMSVSVCDMLSVCLSPKGIYMQLTLKYTFAWNIDSNSLSG